MSWSSWTLFDSVMPEKNAPTTNVSPRIWEMNEDMQVIKNAAEYDSAWLWSIWTFSKMYWKTLFPAVVITRMKMVAITIGRRME